MAQAVKRASRRVTRTRPAAPADNRNVRAEASWIDIHSIQPYEFNPRDNAAAVESVANSIKSFGFIVPVVVDRYGVLAAGHTRVEAAKTLQMSEVLAIRAEHLTPEQIRAFRLIDNKVAELAKWDFDLLSRELQGLAETGIQWTDYGWNREELDCLTDVVTDDCLSAGNLIDAEAGERLRRAERRAPNTARFVLGEVVFFIPRTEYLAWINPIRAEQEFNEEHIVAELKRRLGIEV